MASLYEELRGEYVIWGVGHAGHEVPPGVTLPCLKGKFSYHNHVRTLIRTDMLNSLLIFFRSA